MAPPERSQRKGGSAFSSSKRHAAAVVGLVAALACNAGESTVPSGLYVDPGELFEVTVPGMRNPFVRTPAVSERTLPEGGAEVTFSVVDLGEAWRFGVRGPTAYPDDAALAELCDAELERWRRAGPPVVRARAAGSATRPAPHTVLEEALPVGELSGLARIYQVEGASMLRDFQALIGVATARTEDGRVLFSVAQFDMPMDQWDFFIEDVGRSPGRVLADMAREDMKAMRRAVASLRVR